LGARGCASRWLVKVFQTMVLSMRSSVGHQCCIHQGEAGGCHVEAGAVRSPWRGPCGVLLHFHGGLTRGLAARCRAALDAWVPVLALRQATRHDGQCELLPTGTPAPGWLCLPCMGGAGAGTPHLNGQPGVECNQPWMSHAAVLPRSACGTTADCSRMERQVPAGKGGSAVSGSACMSPAALTCCSSRGMPALMPACRCSSPAWSPAAPRQCAALPPCSRYSHNVRTMQVLGWFDAIIGALRPHSSLAPERYHVQEGDAAVAPPACAATLGVIHALLTPTAGPAASSNLVAAKHYRAACQGNWVGGWVLHSTECSCRQMSGVQCEGAGLMHAASLPIALLGNGAHFHQGCT
jgi:hypothetical protein